MFKLNFFFFFVYYQVSFFHQLLDLRLLLLDGRAKPFRSIQTENEIIKSYKIINLQKCSFFRYTEKI